MSRAARLASAAAVGGAAVATWYRSLDWEGEPDERLSVPTADGWTLGLARYRPRGTERRPWPIVLGHGFAGSGLIFDLGEPWSLARYLADDGFDVFCVDLRGRGSSWPGGRPDPDLHWTFDDLVAHDLPAAVDAACRATGADQAFWGGMEFSGQVLYAAAIDGTAARVRGGVTFGSPAVTPPSAKVPGVTAAPRARRGGRIPFRLGARMAGPILAWTRSSQLESSFRMAHTDPRPVARYFRNGVPDESTVIADQFADWVESGAMRSHDRRTVWSDRLGEITMPMLVLAAAADLQRPPDAVAATAAALGGDTTFVRAGRADGFAVDYGHDDLLVAPTARDEVFPLVRDWLVAHS